MNAQNAAIQKARPPLRSATSTDGALVLSECAADIRNGSFGGSYNCRVTFTLDRPSALQIENVEPLPFTNFSIGTEPFFLSFPEVSKPVECIPIRTTQVIGDHSGWYVTLVPRRANIIVERGARLARVDAGIINLGHYLCGAPSGLSFFELQHGGWDLQFIPVSEETVLYPPTTQDDAYFFTHHLTMRRADGAAFTTVEAVVQLGLLSTFLTFCHGHWVSPGLVRGTSDGGTVVFEEWGTRLVSRWQRADNWLDEHHGRCMKELFSGYCERMADPSWNEAVRTALYWYVRAETSYVGPDGSIILLQAALERLAWHVVVRHRRVLSENAFNKLPAADRLRLLLDTALVPLELPSELTELKAVAKSLKWCDAPETFVGIRNRLVHPPSAAKLINLPYYEAYQLGKWFVELILLRAFGYSGVYANRTRKNRWIGQVEAVPWAITGKTAKF
jgi:hypothetical protein